MGKTDDMRRIREQRAQGAGRRFGLEDQGRDAERPEVAGRKFGGRPKSEEETLLVGVRVLVTESDVEWLDKVRGPEVSRSAYLRALIRKEMGR